MRLDWFAALLLSTFLGCSSGGGSVASMAANSLMGQVGGMDSVTKLAGNFLGSSAKDSRLSGLMGGSDVDSLTPKLSNQLCSMLGGGCEAPLSESEIASGAKQLTPSQSTALKENFASSLGKMDLSSSVRGAVSNAVSSKLPGIVGALL